MTFILALLCGCGSTEPPDVADDPVEAPPPVPVPKHVVLFGAVPDDQFGGKPAATALVELGRKLFSDPRISGDGQRSCASCHPLDTFGTKPGPPSSGEPPARNPPSVYNAGMQFALHWDASVASLEAQAEAALVDPRQSAVADAKAVATKLKSLPDYAAPFEAAFPDARSHGTVAQAAKALAAFERTLTTPGSRLDRYLSGDREALTREEVQGFDRFVETGCNSCHSGALFGGGQVQRLGAVHAWDSADAGREAITGKESDRQLFRVASLRNVVETGPWLHDGSVTDLSEMVRLMAWHQLGKELPEAEVAEIVGFLGTLTGDLPEPSAETTGSP